MMMTTTKTNKQCLALQQKRESLLHGKPLDAMLCMFSQNLCPCDAMLILSVVKWWSHIKYYHLYIHLYRLFCAIVMLHYYSYDIFISSTSDLDLQSSKTSGRRQSCNLSLRTIITHTTRFLMV